MADRAEQQETIARVIHNCVAYSGFPIGEMHMGAFMQWANRILIALDDLENPPPPPAEEPAQQPTAAAAARRK